MTNTEIPMAQYDPVTNAYSIEATDVGPFIVPDKAGMARVIGDIRGNVIHGNGSANILDGSGGDDTLYGEDGDDKLYGGDGNDSLFGGNGSETLEGGAGNDAYSLHFDETIIEFDGGGVDTIIVNTNYILPDHVENMQAVEYSSGFRLTGSSLNNLIIGDAGSNQLNGGAGADTLIGGAGTDYYYVDNKNDVVVEIGSDVSDTVYTSVSYSLSASLEILNASGSAASLVLNGNDSNNFIYASSGSDTLNGGGGMDIMVGATGDDLYYVDHPDDAIAGFAGKDTVIASASYILADDVEYLTASGAASIRLTGNRINNVITGNIGANILKGEAGNDTLKSSAGNDKLHGGLGKDVLYGGTGRDIFVFDTRPNKATNLDRVLDFRVADDTIWLDNKYMPKLGRAGKLNKEFFSLNGRKETDDYLSYSKTTGVLSYDADGSGVKAAAVAIAVLKTGLGLTALDFIMV
jgi:serralysin